MHTVLRLAAAAALTLSIGCPTADDDDATTPMEVAGSYSIVGSQLETTCTGAEWDFWEIFDFMERTANDVPAMTWDIIQDGGALTADMGPADCVWTGSVGADGTFSLRGPCATASMDREITITGNIAPFGNNFDVDGTMVIDVDRDDGAGGGPDGTPDCTVSAVELTGSGSPPAE